MGVIDEAVLEQESAADRSGAPAVPADRDVSRVRGGDWPARELPRVTDRPRTPGFQAVVARSALNDIRAHGHAQPDVEICGVLVGNVYRDRHGPYLHVEANIRGNHAAGRAAQVTFTAETWNHINDEMERNHAGRRILGWYHTHPGFGIFLSEMDLFIQNNFFPEPWQVAFVYDPKRQEDGLFLWKKGRATPGPYLIDPDAASDEPVRESQPPGAPATAAAGDLPELNQRVLKLERKVKWLGGGLSAACALAVISPLIAYSLLPAPAPIDGAASSPRAAPTSSTAAGVAPDDEDEPYIPPSLRMPPATAPTAEPSTGGE